MGTTAGPIDETMKHKYYEDNPYTYYFMQFGKTMFIQIAYNENEWDFSRIVRHFRKAMVW